VARLLAPDCLPLFLTDGHKDSLPALLAHVGHGGQPERRQATGPAPTCSLRRSARRGAGDASSACGSGSCVAPWRRRRRCWRPAAGRARPPSSSASTAACASRWRRWGVASPRGANTRRASGSSYYCLRSMRTSVCLLPASDSCCHSLRPPMARGRPGSGAPAHRPWPRSALPMSGRCARCCGCGCRHGRSQRQDERAVVGGSGKGREPEVAPCVRMACVEDVTRA
jgi:hypothetical protein